MDRSIGRRSAWIGWVALLLFAVLLFLSEIWVQGEQSGRQLQKASRENEMALNYPLQKVELMASLR